MNASTSIVVTRPGEAGKALAAALALNGFNALWLPAFDYGPAPDPHQAAMRIAALPSFDLAIFVSPQAVRATASMLRQRWPATTAIAAVGAATRAAVLSSIEGAKAARLLAPADDGGQGAGSEALWPVLQAKLPRRVLLLRAQSGRDWLGEQLQAAGASVVPLAVYSRSVHAPSLAVRAALAAAARRPLASLVSSSEAVESLREMLATQPEVWQALCCGHALALHPRIAARLREAGFANVSVCPPDAQAITQALRASDAA